MPSFSIDARDGSARAGVLRLAHGEVRTPAFVPLASTGTVKTLHAAEVAELGYDMVLGNTFHLFIRPGAARPSSPRVMATASAAASSSTTQVRDEQTSAGVNAQTSCLVKSA